MISLSTDWAETEGLLTYSSAVFELNTSLISADIRLRSHLHLVIWQVFLSKVTRNKITHIAVNSLVGTDRITAAGLC